MDSTKDQIKHSTATDGKPPVSGSYVVFEDSYEHEALIQLSITLPTLEKAREYVKGWKNKNLYIYKLVE